MGNVIVTPMDVIKTRVQAAKGTKMNASFYEMFKRTLKAEGVRALFKSFDAYLRSGSYVCHHDDGF